MMKFLSLVALCLLTVSQAIPLSINEQHHMDKLVVDSSGEKSSLFDQFIGLLSDIFFRVLKSDAVQSALNPTTILQQTSTTVSTETSSDPTFYSSPSPDPITSTASEAQNVTAQNNTALQPVPEIQYQANAMKTDDTVYLVQDNGTETLIQSQNENQSTTMSVQSVMVTDQTTIIESSTASSALTGSWNVTQSKPEDQVDIKAATPVYLEQNVTKSEDHQNQAQNQGLTSSAQEEPVLLLKDQPSFNELPINQSNVNQTTARPSNLWTLLQAIVQQQQDLLAAAQSQTLVVEQLLNSMNQSVRIRNMWQTSTNNQSALSQQGRQVPSANLTINGNVPSTSTDNSIMVTATSIIPNQQMSTSLLPLASFVSDIVANVANSSSATTVSSATITELTSLSATTNQELPNSNQTANVGVLSASTDSPITVIATSLVPDQQLSVSPPAQTSVVYANSSTVTTVLSNAFTNSSSPTTVSSATMNGTTSLSAATNQLQQDQQQVPTSNQTVHGDFRGTSTDNSITVTTTSVAPDRQLNASLLAQASIADYVFANSTSPTTVLSTAASEATSSSAASNQSQQDQRPLNSNQTVNGYVLSTSTDNPITVITTSVVPDQQLSVSPLVQASDVYANSLAATTVLSNDFTNSPSPTTISSAAATGTTSLPAATSQSQQVPNSNQTVNGDILSTDTTITVTATSIAPDRQLNTSLLALASIANYVLANSMSSTTASIGAANETTSLPMASSA